MTSVSVGWKSGCALVGDVSGLSSCWCWLLSLKTLMRAGGSASKLTQVLSKSFSPLPCEPFQKAVYCPTSARASDLRVKECKGKMPRWKPQCLLQAILKIDILSPVPYSMDHTAHPWYNTERNYTGVWIPGSKGSSGTIMESGYHG